MGRLDYPATTRNREPLWEVLASVLPQRGTILEVASGSGQHVAYFAAQRPDLTWQPSSREPQERASIDDWARPLTNVRPALALDVLEPWPELRVDGMFCANMVHIAPWACTPALMAGAAEVLRAEAPLVLYGPFHVGGSPTSDSNARFDESLQRRDPSWGVRDREDVIAEAVGVGLRFVEAIAMPANNQCLVFERAR